MDENGAFFWEWNHGWNSSMNFSARKVLNFYQGNSKNTNTLLIHLVGHPASNILKRNQNTEHIVCQIKFISR